VTLVDTAGDAGWTSRNWDPARTRGDVGGVAGVSRFTSSRGLIYLVYATAYLLYQRRNGNPPNRSLQQSQGTGAPGDDGVQLSHFYADRHGAPGPTAKHR